MRIVAFIFMVISFTGCSEQETAQQSPEEPPEPQLLEALERIGLDRSAIILPKVPYPVATLARMELVTRSLHDPMTMVGVSRQLVDIDSMDSPAAYTAQLLSVLGINPANLNNGLMAAVSMQDITGQIMKIQADGQVIDTPPPAWQADNRAAAALRALLKATLDAHGAWEQAARNLTEAERQSALDQIEPVLGYTDTGPDVFRFIDEAFNQTGARIEITGLAAALETVLTVLEQSVDVFQSESVSSMAGEWMTPMGRVKIAGKGDDTHSGKYLLLIDPGGNDTYRDVAAVPGIGSVSVVLDLEGDDRVLWERSAGPGAGLLGLGLWADMAGNDHYTGNNFGLGAGLLGAGLFWDARGNDTYETNAMSQGVGQYGIGILLDGAGEDHYSTGFNGQGYGSSGGVGMLLDLDGDDDYACGNYIPDQVEARIKRHRSDRFLSLCQGFGFGIRPDISGGIGLLLDGEGDDKYKADIFGQGAAYWFGLGMLVDRAGNDTYEVFEHGQGSGLHLAAGLLSDWSGNDQYTGNEHTQGVGKDRSAGLLLDKEGDDVYTAHRLSQGAGLSSYGFGFLVELGGDDHYKAKIDSQGYSEPDPDFPGDEWPAGILLDFSGNNTFDIPFSDPVDANGRIQNKQGIAIDYGR